MNKKAHSSPLLKLCRRKEVQGGTPYLYYPDNLRIFRLVLVYSDTEYMILGDGKDGSELSQASVINEAWAKVGVKRNLFHDSITFPAQRTSYYWWCQADLGRLPHITRDGLCYTEVPTELLTAPTSEEQIEILDKIILAISL